MNKLNKEVTKFNEDKQKANWTTTYKKLFIDLVLEQKRLGNRRSKSYKPEAWAYIIKVFNEKTGQEYERLQFKNLYDKLRNSWQAWQSLISRNGIGYDLDAKTFTMSDGRWDEMIKANPQYKQFRHKPLEFEEDLDELFTWNGAIRRRESVPTNDAPTQVSGVNGSSAGEDSLKTTTTENADEAVKKFKKLRKRNRKKSQDSPKMSKKGRLELEEHLMQCMQDLNEVTELIACCNQGVQRQTLSTAHDPLKEALDILNNLEGIEVGSDFYLRALDVLEDPNKRELWLKMPSVARLGWMRRQLDRMGL